MNAWPDSEPTISHVGRSKSLNIHIILFKFFKFLLLQQKTQTNVKSKSAQSPCSTPSPQSGFRAISKFSTEQCPNWELNIMAWAKSSLSLLSHAHHNTFPRGTRRAPQQTVPKHTLTNLLAWLPSTKQVCGKNKSYLRNSICHLQFWGKKWQWSTKQNSSVHGTAVLQPFTGISSGVLQGLFRVYFSPDGAQDNLFSISCELEAPESMYLHLQNVICLL